MSTRTYTTEQIDWIIANEPEYTWADLAKEFKKKFGIKKTANAVRKCHEMYKDIDYKSTDEVSYDAIRKANSARKGRSQASKELKKVLEEIDSQEEFLSQFEKSLKKQPIKVHKPVKLKKKAKKSKRAIVMHLSDTHIQSQIDEEEMAGLNKFSNIEEARRLAFFTKEVADFKKEHRAETDLVIAINGDLGQGIIHDIENTPAMTTQFSAMLHLLTQSISYLAGEFNNVRCVCTVGNHLRMMHKGNKGRQTREKWDSFATMLHVSLKYALSKHKNVSFEIPVSPFAYTEILGHKYFITHSDTVLNIGYPGKSINVETAKNKINDLKEGLGPIDVVLAGHVHVDTKQVLINGTTLLTNGSMSGIDQFALSIGITKSIPTQQMFEVTEEHAVGDLRSIYLNEADEMEELDKIVEPFSGKF